MKSFRYAAMAALAALTLAAGSAFTAGYFPYFPIVGQGSYCASYVTGYAGQICGQTVPAGPSQVNGTEYFIADVSPTSAQGGGGSSPQTVAIQLGSLAGGLQSVYATMASGGSIAMSATQGYLQFIQNGTVSTATTVTLPPANINGQRFDVSSNTTFSSMTFNAPSGYSLTNAPNGITPSTSGTYGYSWIFRLADMTWYRVK